jgi:hypothetical protein
VAWDSQWRSHPAMKLIVVDRAKLQTFQRLIGQFADAMNVKVLLDRRLRQIRKRQEGHEPERRQAERRRLKKPLEGRDYIVVHVADSPGDPPRT